MKLVHGVGVNDVSEPVTYSVNGKRVKHHWYKTWQGMLERCYGNQVSRNRTYEGCTVCNEWLQLSKFKAWYSENHREGFFLDKDLVEPDNKVYCPEMCNFVPNEVNCLFLSCGRVRGDLPQGVSYHKKSGKYSATMTLSNKPKHIGLYVSPDTAHEAYLNAKRNASISVLERNRTILGDEFVDNIIGRLDEFILAKA